MYDIKTYPEITINFLRDLPADRKVRVRCAPGEDLTLPDPAYLDCHHRVAEVLHASGLAEYIERKIRDWQDLKQSGGADGSLRQDGSTDISRILETALWTAVAG